MGQESLFGPHLEYISSRVQPQHIHVQVASQRPHSSLEHLLFLPGLQHCIFIILFCKEMHNACGFGINTWYNINLHPQGPISHCSTLQLCHRD